MAFHGGVGGGVILGGYIYGGVIEGATINGGVIDGAEIIGLVIDGGTITGTTIEGGTIIGPDIQTDTSVPYWLLGPSSYVPISGGQVPAIQAVTANTGHYTNKPAIYYADTSSGYAANVMIVSPGANASDGTSGDLELFSSDSPSVPGGAVLQGRTVIVQSVSGTSIELTSSYIYVTGSVSDQYGNQLPSFQQVNGGYYAGSGGTITLGHNFGSTNVVPLLISNGAFLLRFAAATTSTVSVICYAAGSSTPVASGTYVDVIGFIVSPS